MSEDFDVIIIGTGAGAGPPAHAIAPSGKKILLLERGSFLRREMDNFDPGPVFADGRYISPDTWYRLPRCST
jgi:choline dehydrogenase-like flavoprotein